MEVVFEMSLGLFIFSDRDVTGGGHCGLTNQPEGRVGHFFSYRS